MTDAESRTCRPVALPTERVLEAARRAIEHNPGNAPVAGPELDALMSPPSPFHLAVMTGKNWQAGSTLTVAFLESTPDDLANRIVSHMNAWSGRANIRFVRSTTSPMIRITRSGDGYWSYIGTDILSIPASEPTMCLQGFTMNTPESEYKRVVRHETGHSLGFPHEHSRREIVALLDPSRTIAYFERTQGWSASTIREQVLTPLDQRSLMGTPHAEQDSIMCYQFPGACTVSGQPIMGGVDITEDDFAFAARIYPGLTQIQPIEPEPVAPQIRGSVGPDGHPLFVYVTGTDGVEHGYQFRGQVWVSDRDHKTLVFNGPAELIS